MSSENPKKVIAISKAQEEVWEWKEALYEEIKDMSGEKQLRYIVEGGKKIRAELEELKNRQINNNKI